MLIEGLIAIVAGALIGGFYKIYALYKKRKVRR